MEKAHWRNRFAAILCVAALCMGVLGVCTACGSSNSASTSTQNGTRVFADSCGRQVEVPANIERVAVTGPVSQQVFLTFAPEKLVGLAVPLDDNVRQYLGGKCADLPVYGQIYGGKGDMNKEAVASANPQVIIDIGEGKNTVKADMDALQEQLGIPCVHIEATLSTHDQAYTMLGDLMDMQNRGKELADYCKNAYDTTTAVLAKIPDSQKIRGLYVVGVDGLAVIAKGSFQSQVIDMVFDNVAIVDSPSAKGTGNEVSVEQIALWNPDFMVFSMSIYDTVGQKAEWADISAVKNGIYYDAPTDPYNWLSNPPSVNQLIGLQWLARLVYPDQFPDDMKDVVTGYYKLFYQYAMEDAEYAEFMAHSLQK